MIFFRKQEIGTENHMEKYGFNSLPLVKEIDIGFGMIVWELTYYEANILYYTHILRLGDHADCSNFLVSTSEQRQAEV